MARRAGSTGAETAEKLRNAALELFARSGYAAVSMREIAAETGLAHRPLQEGQRVAGIYRRSVMLASGRYAVLDDGKAFSLVPWKPVIEQRLGQQLAATVRGNAVSWELGRSRRVGI